MKVKIGLCQMKIVDNKKANIEKAEKMILDTVKKGANFVCLPEIFNCPYGNAYFPKYAEKEGEETFVFLSKIARKYNIYLIGGSIPELDDNKIYNTSYIFNPNGELIGKHRKVHLFDIEVEGKIRFMESDILSPGSNLTIIDTEYGKIGVAICFDIRFVEWFRLMAIEGAKLIFLPAAFNMTTGPVHWELSFRARAVDNQVFMVGCAPARDSNFTYISYANSIIVNPWGETVGRLDEKEGTIVKEIDLDMIEKIRQQIPILKNRRIDLYEISKK